MPDQGRKTLVSLWPIGYTRLPPLDLALALA
jgi:hypothetical protein